MGVGVGEDAVVGVWAGCPRRTVTTGGPIRATQPSQHEHIDALCGVVAVHGQSRCRKLAGWCDHVLRCCEGRCGQLPQP